jgi:hypothetical protein
MSFAGFTGFDFNASLPSNKFEYLSEWEDLYFDLAGSFGLYFNGELIKMSSDGGKTCNETDLLNMFNRRNKSSGFFSFSPTNLMFGNSETRVPTKWCASSFKNVNIQKLHVTTNSFRFFSKTRQLLIAL